MKNSFQLVPGTWHWVPCQHWLAWTRKQEPESKVQNPSPSLCPLITVLNCDNQPSHCSHSSQEADLDHAAHPRTKPSSMTDSSMFGDGRINDLEIRRKNQNIFSLEINAVNYFSSCHTQYFLYWIWTESLTQYLRMSKRVLIPPARIKLLMNATHSCWYLLKNSQRTSVAPHSSKQHNDFKIFKCNIQHQTWNWELISNSLKCIWM